MPKAAFTDAYATVLRALIDARKQAGLTQAELAFRVGRTQPIISLIEKGVRRIDVIEFYVLARAIGVDPVALFAANTRNIPSDLTM